MSLLRKETIEIIKVTLCLVIRLILPLKLTKLTNLRRVYLDLASRGVMERGLKSGL